MHDESVMMLKDSGLSQGPIPVITQKESIKDLWNHFSIYVVRDVLRERWGQNKYAAVKVEME